MDANLTPSIVRNRPRQSGATPIVVQPAAIGFVDLMERCHQQAYGYGPDQLDAESLTAEKFRNHLSVFPEGQFVALDSRSRQVVGTSTNMRRDFDFARDSAVSWAELTKDG